MRKSLKNHYKPWLDEEIQKLRDEYQLKGAIQLALELERSYDAVQSRAQSIGVTRKDVKGKNNPMYGKRPGNWIPRETRTCAAPNCNITFECKITSKKKYCQKGHSRKGRKETKEVTEKRFKNRLPFIKAFRTKWCECGCGGQFKEDSRYPQRFIYGHNGKNLARSKEVKQKLRRAGIKAWQDPVYREKQLKAMFVGIDLKPNKPEKFLTKLLQKLFPNQYKYVGDGSVLIRYKNPDFVNINGQKKIIEMFGDYWHSEEVTGRTTREEEQQRINHFAKYGYHTLIIWEHELEDFDFLKKKLLLFNS